MFSRARDGGIELALSRDERALLANLAADLRAQLDGYLDRIIDRDFPELGHQIRNPAALRRWMAAYAAASSTTTSFEKIRDAATGGEGEKPAKTTVQPYRDVLERLAGEPFGAWLDRVCA